jgi:hypothetical protein
MINSVKRYHKNLLLRKEIYQNGDSFLVLYGQPKGNPENWMDDTHCDIVCVWDNNNPDINTENDILETINQACNSVWKKFKNIEKTDIEEKIINFPCVDCKWRTTFLYPPMYYAEWRCSNGNNNGHMPERIRTEHIKCKYKKLGEQYFKEIDDDGEEY